MKRYKVVKRVYSNTVDNEFKIRKHIEMKRDLPWKEAKKLARELNADIVPM